MLPSFISSRNYHKSTKHSTFFVVIKIWFQGDNVLGSLPVFRSIIEIEVPRDTIKMTGDDQKALAGVLDTFRIGRGESLFKKKGDDFGRKIAQIPIATPYVLKYTIFLSASSYILSNNVSDTVVIFSISFILSTHSFKFICM